MSADTVRFTAYVTRQETIVAYIMPLVTDTAAVAFKNEATAHITQTEPVEASIVRTFNEEVEL